MPYQVDPSAKLIRRLELLLPVHVMRIWRESRKFSWAIADQVVVSGGNFISSVLLARLLGIQDFGVYVLAWAIVSFVQSIQFSTISMAMLSIGPKHDTKTAQSFFGGIFLQQIVFGLASALLTWIGTWFAAALFPHAKLELIAPALATAVLSCQAQDFLRRYFFTTTRPEISFAVDILRYFVQIAALLVLYASIKSSFNSEIALWIASGAAAFASVAILPCVSPMKWSVEEALRQARRHWHFSKWLTASALLTWAIGNLLFVATGMLIGTAAVGGIRAAQNVIGMAHIVMEVAINIVPPRASREFVTGGRPKLRAYLQRVTLYGSISIVAVTAIFAFKPEFWLLLVFGDEFRSYGPFVRWWALIELTIFFGLVVGTWLRTYEDTKFIFYAYAISALISIGLAYPLISQFGAEGAIAGILIVQIVQVALMLVGVKLAGKKHTQPGG